MRHRLILGYALATWFALGCPSSDDEEQSGAGAGGQDSGRIEPLVCERQLAECESSCVPSTFIDASGSSANRVAWVDVASDRAVLATSRGILSAELSASEASAATPTKLAEGSAWELVVHGGHVYWVPPAPAKAIMRAALDGSSASPTTLIALPQGASVQDLFVTDDKVRVLGRIGSSAAGLYEADNREGAELTVVAGLEDLQASSAAVVGDALFWIRRDRTDQLWVRASRRPIRG